MWDKGQREESRCKHQRDKRCGSAVMRGLTRSGEPLAALVGSPSITGWLMYDGANPLHSQLLCIKSRSLPVSHVYISSYGEILHWSCLDEGFKVVQCVQRLLHAFMKLCENTVCGHGFCVFLVLFCRQGKTVLRVKLNLMAIVCCKHCHNSLRKKANPLLRPGRETGNTSRSHSEICACF